LEAFARPDPEVLARPKRRRFTAEYRLSIVREADACTRKGELGALLRREGLYSSYLTQWRQQRNRGGLDVEKRGASDRLRRRATCVCARRTRSSPRNGGDQDGG
jgi:transposase-like protein